MNDDIADRILFEDEFANPDSVVCPNCSSKCKKGAKFCKVCGTMIGPAGASAPENGETSAPRASENPKPQANAGGLEIAEASDTQPYKEPPNALATGLPKWDLEPKL